MFSIKRQTRNSKHKRLLWKKFQAPSCKNKQTMDQLAIYNKKPTFALCRSTELKLRVLQSVLTIFNLFLALSTIWNRYFQPPRFDLNTILPSKTSKNRVTVQQSKNFWAPYPPLSLTDLGFSSTNWKNQQKKNNQWNSTSILSKIIRIIKRSSHYNKSKSHSFFLSSVELQLENNWTAITMPMRTLMNR